MTESPLVDFDAVCHKVRVALEPARTHAVSLHDEHGDVLWLSESSMGPDEHNAVREAAEAFADPSAAPVLAHDLGDSRSAVLVRAINHRRAMVGIVMIIMDSRIIAPGATKLMTPKLQRVLAEFAAMRPDGQAPVEPPALNVSAAAPQPAAPRPAASKQAAPKPAASGPTASKQDVATPVGSGSPSMSMASPRAVASKVPTVSVPAAYAKPVAAASASARAQMPTELTVIKRPERAVTPEIDRLHAALRKSPIALHVQRLMPLAKGSQYKRYEVLLRSKADSAPNVAPAAMLKAAVDNGLGSMIDRRVITELIGWLVRHADVWQNDEVMFSVNLTTTALHDEHFIKFVGLCLAKGALPKGIIAFEIDSPTALKLSDRISEVAAALHRLGCPLVLDDFALRTECFALLRLPGVRYVKLAPEITAKMRTDKLSQAAITAVVQMARVLGMHTVAKRTESAAEQEWLTALGVDFVQSNSMSPPVAIDSLSKVQMGKSAPVKA